MIRGLSARLSALFLCAVLGACEAPIVETETVLAAVATLAIPSVPAADAPELAPLGDYAVGTTVSHFDLGPSVKLTAQGIASGELEKVDRSLEVRIWYPAALDSVATRSDGASIRYQRMVQLPGADAIEISMPGIAHEDAAPMSGHDNGFPLVVVSHGFAGWNAVMSNLTENLASKGYVVAAIDHADISEGSGDSQLDFANVFINRVLDQKSVIKMLLHDAAERREGYSQLIDTSRVGLIGYSMGGFGALATAGAPYNPNSNAMNFLSLPQEIRSLMTEELPDDVKDSISSLVLMAPWGAQPMFRAWSEDALRQIDTPVLLIDGNLDDIVEFDTGPRWIFENLTGSDRYLLIYQMARHNIANNAVHAYVNDLTKRFQTLEYFSEPVWRTERLNAINQHFITAFLDLTLKGDQSKQAYLDVPMTDSNDADWPVAFGQTVGDSKAADDQPNYWRGFQRRWALGMELHHKEALRD